MMARRAIGVLLLVAAIAAGAWLGFRKNEREPWVDPADDVVATTTPTPAVPADAAPKHPIEAIASAPEPVVEPEEPLPSLADSDRALLAALATLFGENPVNAYANPEFVIQRIVATVDNLPRRKLAREANPVKPPLGALQVDPVDAANAANAVDAADADRAVLGAANYARYAPYVEAAERVDTARLAATYRRFYPLFQEAYAEIAPPGAYFNDRLVEVIDHLAAASDATGPVELRRDRAYWTFADPALEARSAGEKLMIRMGPQQAARVRAKLSELKGAITRDDEAAQAQPLGG